MLQVNYEKQPNATPIFFYKRSYFGVCLLCKTYCTKILSYFMATCLLMDYNVASYSSEGRLVLYCSIWIHNNSYELQRAAVPEHLQKNN
jgi:hypothetical protein